MMPITAEAQVPSGLADMPLAPTTYQDAGLTLDLLIQLSLKMLHFAGELTGAELAKRLGVNFSVVEPALDALKTQRQVEIGAQQVFQRLGQSAGVGLRIQRQRLPELAEV